MSQNELSRDMSAAYEWKKIGELPITNYWVGSRSNSPVEDAPLEYEKGFEEGRQDGLERGLLEAQAQVDSVLTTLRDGIESVERERAQLLHDTTHDMKSIVEDMFEVLFGYELRSSPRFVDAICDAAKDVLNLDAPVSIQMNPGDYADLAAHVDENDVELAAHISAVTSVQAGTIRLASAGLTNEVDVIARLRETLAGLEVNDSPEQDFETGAGEETDGAGSVLTHE